MFLAGDFSIPIIVVVGGSGIELARANAAVWLLSIGLRQANYTVVIWLQSANVNEETLQI